MREFWNWIIITDIAAAVLFACNSVWAWWRHRHTPPVDQSRALTIRSKPVIIGFISALSIVLIAGFGLYGRAYPPDFFGCMAYPAMLEYGAFALPCLAGIAAGVGFVYKKSQNEIDKSLDLRFYMGSVGILALAMGFYIAGHPRPLVVVAISFTVAVAAIVGLIATVVARASWKLDEGQVKSSPYACCESNHCANGLLAHTELSLEAAPKKTIGVTDNAPSAEQRAKRDKLNRGVCRSHDILLHLVHRVLGCSVRCAWSGDFKR